MSASVTTHQIVKVFANTSEQTDDLLAVEEPLETRIIYSEDQIIKEKSVSITMRTPGNDFELSAGFLFTEGIIKQGCIDKLSYCQKAFEESGESNVVKVVLKSDYIPQLLNAERNFYISGSCGICGKTSIESIYQQCDYAPNFDVKIQKEIIWKLEKQLKENQVNFKYTGGIHASALYTLTGDFMRMREDVGRHNALDKLIGSYLISNELPLHNTILLLSGRAGFELIQKAAMAGINIIASIGAPTSLAVKSADQLGITLIGFLKDNSFNIYSHPSRIIID